MTKQTNKDTQPKSEKKTKTITKEKIEKQAALDSPDLKLQHRKIMEANGCDIDKFIVLRKDFHKHAEIAFKEFRTQQKIIDILKTFGIEDENIVKCAGTGLVVDIKGTMPADKSPGCHTVALRTDIDALPMPEHNQGLEYKTITEFAHMCGHDGHMAMLLAGAQVIAANRDKIPSNKTVRLLFQPAEEGPGGAEPMIKEGCLIGVDEVYGLHNIPNFEAGSIKVINGPIFAEVTIVKIKVTGHGGHGSAPHNTKDPINASAFILTALNSIKSRCIHSKENFVFTICNFQSGSTYNVMPGEAFMQGTVRTYGKQTKDKVLEKITQICESTAKAHDCTAAVEFVHMYPSVINHATEADHVRRVAINYFGGVSDEGLPVTASEDFSFFLQEKPGAFFVLGTWRKNDESLHSSTYDFNDKVLATGALFWIRLVEDRLNVKLI